MNRPLVSVIKLKKPKTNINDKYDIYHRSCGYHDCTEDLEHYTLNSERLVER